MPQTCKACKHPKRAEINKAIVSGEPLRDIAGRVSLSKAALHQHKEHVSTSLVKASERREESIAENVLKSLQNLCQRAEKVLERAENAGAGKLSLLAIRECRDTLGAIYKLTSDAAVANREHNPSACPHCSPAAYQQAMITSVRSALGVDGPPARRIESGMLDEPPALETWGARASMTSGDGTPVPFTRTEPPQSAPEEKPTEQPGPTTVFPAGFVPGESWPPKRS